MKIVPIARRHSADLAKMHLAFLRSQWGGQAGLKLLSIYYQGIADGVGAGGFAAEENSKIVGYVCGIWSPGSLKGHLVRRYFFGLAFWAARQVVSRPQMAAGFWQQLRARPAGTVLSGYELRPIVVMREYRGTGLAARLTHCLLDDASRRGYDKIFLYTEVDNLTAQRFYQKVGFTVSGQQQRAHGAYTCYECSTRMPA